MSNPSPYRMDTKPVSRFTKGVKNDAELLASWRMFAAGVHPVAAEHDETTVREGFMHVRVKHEFVHQIIPLPPVLLAQRVVVFQIRRTPRALHIPQLS